MKFIISIIILIFTTVNTNAIINFENDLSSIVVTVKNQLTTIMSTPRKVGNSITFLSGLLQTNAGSINYYEPLLDPTISLTSFSINSTSQQSLWGIGSILNENELQSISLTLKSGSYIDYSFIKQSSASIYSYICPQISIVNMIYRPEGDDKDCTKYSITSEGGADIIIETPYVCNPQLSDNYINTIKMNANFGSPLLNGNSLSISYSNPLYNSSVEFSNNSIYGVIHQSVSLDFLQILVTEFTQENVVVYVMTSGMFLSIYLYQS
jgi:hypothetical protein